MQAIIYTTYGSPDVLQLTTLEKPTLKANEVLVKVVAASANPLDWHLMRGAPFLARLEAGLFKPTHQQLGADIAGRVEAIGQGVTQVHVGDAVFGCMSMKALGAFAEYARIGEETLVAKPVDVSFEAAAAVPIAALTALQGLRNKGQVQAGQKVLINGASGGVGTFAVQIAKALGAEVTGVCSTRNLDLVRSLGADHVIDYTQADFTTNGQVYDMIYCAVGNRSLADYLRALTPTGKCVIAGFTNLPLLFSHMIVGPMRSKADGKQIGIQPTVVANKQDLIHLRDLLESKKIVPVIDRRFTLGETAEAIRYLETGRARGKVLIMVDPNNPA